MQLGHRRMLCSDMRGNLSFLQRPRVADSTNLCLESSGYSPVRIGLILDGNSRHTRPTESWYKVFLDLLHGSSLLQHTISESRVVPLDVHAAHKAKAWQECKLARCMSSKGIVSASCRISRYSTQPEASEILYLPVRIQHRTITVSTNM